MYVLAIESAGPIGGAAVVGPKECYETLVPLGPGHGEILPEIVRDVLHRAKVGWRELSLLAVDIGPGSFTGLRVGLSLAKAIAQVHGLPVVPVRQTEAVGLPLAELWPGRVCVWIHDRREYLYMGWVDRERAGQEVVLPFVEALARLQERPGTLVAGTGALRFAQELKAHATGVVLAPSVMCFPRPSVVAQIAKIRYTREGPAELLALEPHYIHKEDGHGESVRDLWPRS
ncbi:MAG: tRNA (adenosine(37)-N6)-threonylcarbamoyltransferase complex dimerization subunit type 1 TsaB [Candidatus Bipolaricaulota bacterium]|nr:tRNA (adenosine(37)-N6)-threonylcarbamoyltransferase complex dimerization subunit type 1 TsaB [Candidatus Bipolaricaulota bacterium]MDW8126712.1 tRNA (adenosine(37)-N6)-threonylcarbamoyltransferase complex dimerization subunit type 1 TsaB [Candidatus Bipolaricaulota bacterium]